MGSKVVQTMTSKQRLLTALDGGRPDRLPVTTHHLMPSFLNQYMDGITNEQFFERFSLDPIQWVVPHKPDTKKGQYVHPDRGTLGFLQSRYIAHDDWRLEWEPIPHPDNETVRYRFRAPKGSLSMVLQSNEHTSWVSEHLIKNKRDIDLLGEYMTAPLCDVEQVNDIAAACGQRALIRGHVCCFDAFGQPGVWQDAACLVGIERLMMETFDDAAWVRQLLDILFERKKTYVQSLPGAAYDILELSGGDASTTVISPKLFDEYVAPYDSQLIELAHQAGQRIVYHTCGGMMPILEKITAMQPDALETFTPPEMGGDVNLTQARQRIPPDICMIGGFNQVHYLKGCSAATTRTHVRACFEATGRDGSYILSPCDHFFEADIELLEAFADEAKSCVYA